MNTLKDFFDDHFTGIPYQVAKERLYEMLQDLDMLDAFAGGAYGPDDIMDNIERLEK